MYLYICTIITIGGPRMVPGTIYVKYLCTPFKIQLIYIRSVDL